MRRRLGGRGWRVPPVMTAVVAALVLLLTPAGHSWAGAGGGAGSVAQTLGAHDDETVAVAPPLRAAAVHPTRCSTDVLPVTDRGVDDRAGVSPEGADAQVAAPGPALRVVCARAPPLRG